MDLSDEPARDRQSFLLGPYSTEAVIQGFHIVRHFDDIGVLGRAGSVLVLEAQQFRKGGLRTFDLGREERLLSDIHIEKHFGVGQDPTDSIESSDRFVSLTQQNLQFSEPNRGGWRQGRRNEGLGSLPGSRDGDPPSEATGWWFGHVFAGERALKRGRAPPGKVPSVGKTLSFLEVASGDKESLTHFAFFVEFRENKSSRWIFGKWGRQ